MLIFKNSQRFTHIYIVNLLSQCEPIFMLQLDLESLLKGESDEKN